MKILIAASIILASGVTHAQSFDYEKAVGSADLFSTLNSDKVLNVDSGHNGGFAYQESVGSNDLFPTPISADAEPQISGDNSAFAYQEVSGNELDPSLS